MHLHARSDDRRRVVGRGAGAHKVGYVVLLEFFDVLLYIAVGGRIDDEETAPLVFQERRLVHNLKVEAHTPVSTVGPARKRLLAMLRTTTRHGTYGARHWDGWGVIMSRRWGTSKQERGGLVRQRVNGFSGVASRHATPRTEQPLADRGSSALAHVGPEEDESHSADTTRLDHGVACDHYLRDAPCPQKRDARLRNAIRRHLPEQRRGNPVTLRTVTGKKEMGRVWAGRVTAQRRDGSLENRTGLAAVVRGTPAHHHLTSQLFNQSSKSLFLAPTSSCDHPKCGSPCGAKPHTLRSGGSLVCFLARIGGWDFRCIRFTPAALGS